jgi:hypothetical protein
MTTPIQTAIVREGQRYYHEPIYQTMKPVAELVTPLANSIAAMFGRRTPALIHEVIGHECIRLRWMKPDGKGGLAPKGER